MPQAFAISGTILNSLGVGSAEATINFTISGGSSVLVFANSKGQYAKDLADIGYNDGDTVLYSAEDKFFNEVVEGSFVGSGDVKTLDLTMVPRENALVPASNRTVQMANIGGKPVSADNPFPITSVFELNGHPDIRGNVQLDLDFAFASPDSRPSAETITSPDGIRYRRTFTYDSGKRLTSRSRWNKI